MAHIRGYDTKPEIFFRKALWKWGIRYRKNVKDLFGKPDIAIKKYKLVVFIGKRRFYRRSIENFLSNDRFFVRKI